MTDIGPSPSLAAQQLAFLGLGLFVLETIGFGLLDYLVHGRLQ